MDCIIKEKDISILHRNGAILKTIFEETRTIVKPGISLLEIDGFVNSRMNYYGARPATLNYKGPNGIVYKHSCCLSPNNIVVHGVPDKTILKEGDIFSLDAAIEKDGVYVDKCVNIPLNEISHEAFRIISATEYALENAIGVALIGNKIGDISNVIYETIKSFGFDVPKSFIGHGIGYKFHTYPDVPNHGVKGTGPELVENMCIAIEPIAISGKPPLNKVFVKDDGWTFQNLGGISSHCEDTIQITKNGPIIVTRLDVSIN